MKPLDLIKWITSNQNISITAFHTIV